MRNDSLQFKWQSRDPTLDLLPPILAVKKLYHIVLIQNSFKKSILKSLLELENLKPQPRYKESESAF